MEKGALLTKMETFTMEIGKMGKLVVMVFSWTRPETFTMVSGLMTNTMDKVRRYGIGVMSNLKVAMLKGKRLDKENLVLKAMNTREILRMVNSMVLANIYLQIQRRYTSENLITIICMERAP